MPQSETYTAGEMRAEKRSVAQNSVFAAVAITLLKVIVGITTGSALYEQFKPQTFQTEVLVSVE